MTPPVDRHCKVGKYKKIQNSFQSVCWVGKSNVVVYGSLVLKFVVTTNQQRHFTLCLSSPILNNVRNIT